MNELNYPQPDPSWDYALAWECLWGARNRIDEIIRYMKTVETANYASDKYIFDELKLAIDTVDVAIKTINSDPSRDLSQ